MRKGRYQKQLYQVFLLLGILVFVLPQVIFAVSYTRSYQQHYRNTMLQAVQSRTSGTELSLSVITTALYSIIGSGNITLWGNSQIGSSGYYYHAAQGYIEIQKVLSGLSQLDYSIAVTTLNPDSFVISRNGTCAKPRFFHTETTLSPEQTEAVFEHFSQTARPLTLPVYSADHTLSELYYMISRRALDSSNLLYIVRIPFRSLFSSRDPMILFDDYGIVAYSDTTLRQLELPDKIRQSFGTEKSQEFSSGGRQVYAEKLQGLDWKIAYLYKEVPVNRWQQLLLFFCLSFTLLFVAVQFARAITKKLYRPIGQMVEELADNKKEDSTTVVDEFQLVHQSTDRLRELTRELRAILQEKAFSDNKQFYRDLLLGTSSPSANSHEDQSYCVCLIKFSEEEDVKLFLIKSNVEACVQRMEKGHYVSMGRDRSAIVMEVDSLDAAKAMIMDMFSKMEDRADSCIAISDVMRGTSQISTCYRQTIKILEYRYFYDKTEILTMQQITRLDNNSYYYPLQTEKRLLHCIADGSDEAIRIYREVVQENTEEHMLSPDAQKNFRFALLGTLGRAFQELKTTPESLLGESIDFEKLYGQWNSSTLLEDLERIISAVVAVKHESSQNMDNEILRAMTQYIHENYSDDIMLNDMAQVFNISPKYCSMLFKRLSDDTFKNYLNGYRMERAKSLIQENPAIKINDLSRMVGYNSANSFIRVFSRYIGVTPKAFADEVQKKQEQPSF
ncbi:MAG: helix-turn-helix domain-containing protein [Angelakisella sp.]